MNRAPSLDILGLFPAFGSAVFGGIQASGRQAWLGIENQPGIRADAFYYEQGAPKLSALCRAVARRVTVDTVLVWHLGLLKLTPLIAASNRRRVLFLHGIEAWRNHDPFTSLLMRGTDLFLTNSDHTWKRFTSFHPDCAAASQRTVHLGMGASLDRVPTVPDAPPVALMIGRMQKDENYKGHREMIRVWPLVLDSMPTAELWIVGGGDLRPELEELTRSLNLVDRVKFFGAVPDSRKEDLLRSCRVLALPSAGEGFGLVYLEAMRMGRPCIVSSLDAGAEVVNPPEAGVSVDLAAPAQVADSMIRLLSPGPAWDQMSLRARQRYDSRFTAGHFERRLLAALFGQ